MPDEIIERDGKLYRVKRREEAPASGGVSERSARLSVPEPPAPKPKSRKEEWDEYLGQYID